MLKNKKIKFLLIIFFVTLLLLIASNISNAASASISCNSSATVGESISIQVSGTAVQWNLELKVNGTTIATSNELDNYEENKNISFSGSYTPTQAGTLTVTLEGSITEANGGAVTRNFASKTITVTEPASEPEPTPEPTPDPEPEPEQPNNGSENQGGEQQTGETYTFSTITIDGTKYENGDTLTVENDKSSVRVQANIPTNYSISVNGNSVSGFNVNLGEGTNTIKVTDLSSGKTITVNVTRMPLVEENTPPNVMDNTEVSENTVDEETAEDSGLKLEKLTIEGLELIPEFDPDIYSYTVNINMDEQDYSSLNIDAVANDYMASVGIDGNQNLQEGENIINIILTSADGEEIVTYQLIVNKITSASEVVGEKTNEDNNQKMPIIIAIVAIIVIVIIVAIIVLVRKYKKMNPDYDDYDGYGLYDYDLYNKQDDNSDNNQNYEDDNPYKFNNSDEETQDSEEYDYDDPIQDEGKKKKKRGKGKHA